MKNLLLHICCGPCATTSIEQLLPQYDITGYFFNPNILPESEYFKRLENAEKTCAYFGIQLLVGEYSKNLFLEKIKGFENEPEGGYRCEICFALRLSETARKAKENNLKAFASTLTVGPSKKASTINSIGLKESENYNLEFVAGDWKKKDGYKRSVELSKMLDLYRQNYCGCAGGHFTLYVKD